MRVIALLATYNERRFVGACIEHLHAQGVETYLIDNSSTDATVKIAERHRGRGLIGVEHVPRDGVYRWRALLERKEELSRELAADWFIHHDADEFRLPSAAHATLADALEAADREGFDAVNFTEFTFVPTRESPDHDHPEFQRTLRTYYPFQPSAKHQVNAWKANAAEDLGLARSGGHGLDFPGIRIDPEPLPMKHYLFLSPAHAVEKYVQRQHDPDELASGWHGWRATLTENEIRLPNESELRVLGEDGVLDASNPRTRHVVDPTAG